MRVMKMNQHEKINYIEFPTKNIETTKDFFTAVFGWSFVDYGPDYTAFSNAGIDGGFFKSDLTTNTSNGSALIVFYSKDLEQQWLENPLAKDEDMSLFLKHSKIR